MTKIAYSRSTGEVSEFIGRYLASEVEPTFMALELEQRKDLVTQQTPTRPIVC